jgi:NAD(P)H-nitrite reductase large subunit
LANEDIEICYCLGTHKSEIEKAILDHQLKCIEDVKENGIAATYCGRCTPDIEIIFKELNLET